MNARPLLLRLTPPRLRMSVWRRFYHPATDRLHPLFSGAYLSYAPKVQMKLLPGDAISESIALTGIHELDFTRWLTTQAKMGGQFVDVGANLGYFSLLWAAARADNSVIAFEASPRNAEFLRRNIADNGFDRRIDVRSEAVGRESGEMHFDLGPEEQTGWGGLSNEPTARSQIVRVVRLDEALDGSDEIRAMKIDVEGADTWALLGAERLLRERRIRHVWWEQNRPRIRRLGIAENDAAEFMRTVGYCPQMLTSSKRRASWYATY